MVVVVSPEFGNPDYTTLEDVGTLHICLNITEPLPDTPFDEVFNIESSTANGTAGMQKTLCLGTCDWCSFLPISSEDLEI